jgi:thymidylate synthase (FAD)
VNHFAHALTHELVRHRVGVAISQRSTRYVDEEGSEWVEHPAFDLVDDSPTDEYEEAGPYAFVMTYAREAYASLFTDIEEELRRRGVEPTLARKQARGAARLVLGNGLETELLWSANIRALRHVIRLRGSVHADAEIRQLALALLSLMRQEAPRYFDDFTVVTSPDTLGDAIE